MNQNRIRIDDIAGDAAKDLTEKEMAAIRGGFLSASRLLAQTAAKGKSFKEVEIHL